MRCIFSVFPLLVHGQSDTKSSRLSIPTQEEKIKIIADSIVHFTSSHVFQLMIVFVEFTSQVVADIRRIFFNVVGINKCLGKHKKQKLYRKTWNNNVKFLVGDKINSNTITKEIFYNK